jgi:hypothetical protein
VLCGRKGYLLLKNTYRGLWELPGGMMDPGDGRAAEPSDLSNGVASGAVAGGARQCVVRECFEESNQIVPDPEFIGLARLAFAPMSTASARPSSMPPSMARTWIRSALFTRTTRSAPCDGTGRET